MPTGYTYNIKEGITFKEFIMQCARAFGAYVTMRDEPNDAPAPEKFKPDNYHVKALKEAKKRLAKLELLTMEEAVAMRDKEYNEEVNSRKEYAENQKLVEFRYRAMLKEVDKWKPPTSEHEGLKKFMAEQIQQSIDFDCIDIYKEPLKKIPVEKWLLYKKKEALRDIEYHEEQYEEEVKRVDARNKWIAELKKSID